LAPPRQSKPETTADDVAVLGGSTVSSDRFYDLSVKVAGIERSIAFLEGHSDSANTKLDKIMTDLAAARATFSTLKWIFTATVVGVWGVILALVAAWARHYFGS